MKTCRTMMIVLAALLLLAGWGRWISASHVFDIRHNPDKSLFFDEYVYIALSQNLLERGQYSTQQQYPKMVEHYSSVPRYLNDPLFKHPPLVPLAVGLSMKVFDRNIRAAFLPGLVLGTAMIAVVYLLGLATVRDRAAAGLAALLLAVSPTHWICSSRIFLEAPLSFFILAAITVQLWNVRSPRACWMSAGFWLLAWWTKYTSVPIWGLFQLALLVAYPRLLRNPAYRWSQLTAAALFLPWWLWRLRVEGSNVFFFWRSQTEEWQAFGRLLGEPSLWMGITVLILLVGWVGLRRKEVLRGMMRGSWVDKNAGWLAVTCGVAALLMAVWQPAIVRFDALPWSGNGLNNELKTGPATTYFLRQVWFEPLTFLGMTLGLVLPGSRKLQVLKWMAVATALLMTVWGNYQMRYFLPVIPFWEVLSVAAVLFLFRVVRAWSRPGALALVVILTGWSLLRSVWLDWKIAIPNDAFYF